MRDRVLLFWVTLLGIDEIVTLVCFSFDWLHLIYGTHLLHFAWLVLDRSMVKVRTSPFCYHRATKKLSFLLHQEELLRAKYTARSCNSDPANKLLSRYFVCFHSIEPDKCACASQSSLAMDGNSTWVCLREVSFTDVQEILNNVFWWIRTVHKEQLIMCDTIGDKLPAIVFCLVQPNDSLDVPLFENIAVLFWGKARSLSGLTSV